MENGQHGTDSWGLSVPNTMLAINTRLVKIHGFTPAELMFGYKPVASRLVNEQEYIRDPEEYAPHLHRLHIENRDELREEARQAMALVHRRMEGQRNPVWTRPKEGDLVLLWNAQLEKQHGRKLESRWSEPQRLVKVNSGGVSGMVSKLYGDGSLRRIHLDDMKVYCPRSIYPALVNTHATVSYVRNAMKYAGRMGQRAVDLSH